MQSLMGQETRAVRQMIVTAQYLNYYTLKDFTTHDLLHLILQYQCSFLAVGLGCKQANSYLNNFMWK